MIANARLRPALLIVDLHGDSALADLFDDDAPRKSAAPKLATLEPLLELLTTGLDR